MPGAPLSRVASLPCLSAVQPRSRWDIAATKSHCKLAGKPRVPNLIVRGTPHRSLECRRNTINPELPTQHAKRGTDAASK
jgi:hypothetical protein